ncbi:universal stress protein [Halovivax sp.]|uniref:universal stress protein n=1 Tax=Halovivax sp. TaxID=1935978 RepID=UPI0025C495B4|nr:Usp family protein [Halovivax sp.]
MVVVAVVSATTNAEEVVIEAARRADELDATVHVLYLLALGRYAALELAVADAFGLPTGVTTMEELCARKAERIAVTAFDEFEAVGLVGRPVDELVDYVEAVDADSLVVDGEAPWSIGFRRTPRPIVEQLRERGVTVVPVY